MTRIVRPIRFVTGQLLSSYALLASTAAGFALSDKCPIFFTTQRQCEPITPSSFLPSSVDIASQTRSDHIADSTVVADVLDALNVTQSEFFAPWSGTWPDSIHWTSAVIGTHISGAARSISEDLVSLGSKEGNRIDWRRASNLINNYLTQTVAYYFGQDALAMRYEAYDDMLWVVLGWLEAIQFVNTHSDLYYNISNPELSGVTPGVTGGRLDSYTETIPNQPYHGNVWIPAFSHRARIFWDLASHGWDTELCDGGMLWNPRLLPYKNAITNELYIAASISMYLHYPGDDNASPSHNRTDDRFNPEDPDAGVPSGRRDARYLKAAVDGYRWLRNANMTNDQGLVVDGFHISGYLDENDNNTRCDARSEAVFSYNQGVVLTGQRGLWDATGAPSFLKDGHRLIQSVVRATGYNLASDRPIDDYRPLEFKAGVLPRWHGLGRLGVMEEYVDASGTASQDVQTFKGIFFHHLAAFCAPLTEPGAGSGVHIQIHGRAFAAVKKTHAEACKSYGGWLEHNVKAAMGTRDDSGRFGQWWTAALLMRDWVGPWPTLETDGIDDKPNVTEYRDHAAPGGTTTWRGAKTHTSTPTSTPTALPYVDYAGHGQLPIERGSDRSTTPLEGLKKQQRQVMGGRDPNDRGRGRTVETQSGGLGLLRAYWKIARAS